MGDFVQKIFKKGICVLLACVFVFAISSCGKQNTDVQSLFTDPKKMSYSTDYYELSATKTNKTSVWRQGMVSGNGLQGVVTSGSPYSDTLIFQNIHFILPNQNTRDCPVTSDELETVKQNIAAGKDITDDAEYLEVYSFHRRFASISKSTVRRIIFAIPIMKPRRSAFATPIPTGLGSVLPLPRRLTA